MRSLKRSHVNHNVGVVVCTICGEQLEVVHYEPKPIKDHWKDSRGNRGKVNHGLRPFTPKEEKDTPERFIWFEREILTPGEHIKAWQEFDRHRLRLDVKAVLDERRNGREISS